MTQTEQNMQDAKRGKKDKLTDSDGKSDASEAVAMKQQESD